MTRLNRELLREKIEKDSRRSIKIAACCVAVLIVVICLFANAGCYIGGESGLVKAYTLNDKGRLTYSADVVRGTSVHKTGETADLEIRGEMSETMELCYEVEFTDKDGKEQKYFINEKNLVRRRSDIVQEKTLYVRTPLSVYETEDGPDIASYMPKGSVLGVVEVGRLQDDGFVDQYKVHYLDSTGKSGEGYIYGKYVVGSEEEAKENYNLHGEYDTACEAEYGFDLGGGHARNLDYFPVEKPELEGNELCTNARTMYINTYAAIHTDPYVKLIEETDCNAVVIDIKDGQLTYKSEVAKELSPYGYEEAYASEAEFKKGVDAYKKTGVYTIGRIVVFNDTRYARNHPEDCIKTSGSGKSWPSGYSRAVWEYNVKLAIEAVEKFGFDEIQFDYVRFPEASYEMSRDENTDFRNTYGEEKAQAIQNFCYYACDQIHKAGAYVSIDVFGESSYTYVTAYGQYWPAISNVVDAVSSMPYSDHHGEHDTWSQPYNTLNAWAKRTAERQSEIPTPAIDRTWITGYNTPYWNPTVNYDTAKMKEQIKALTDAGLKGGFIPWNVLSDIDKYREYKDIWNK